MLSPLIWNLPFNKLLTLYDTGPTHALGFADDIGLLVCGPDPATLVSTMQVTINKAQRWGSENGLIFGVARTIVVVFSNKQEPLKDFSQLTLGGTPLEYSEMVKYLGITLDSKLTFNCKQAKRLLYSLKNAIGKLWGPSLSSMKWFYQAMVYPIIRYGSIVWAHKAPQCASLLRRVQ